MGCNECTAHDSGTFLSRAAAQLYRRTKLAAFIIGLALPIQSFAQAQMSTPGSFAVSPSGAATYTIPIQVPPGTAGMQPSLALSYNSQAGNGLAGMGWSLSGLSAIHRCPATIVQGDGYMGGINYDANDRFCLDGERLVVVNGLANGANGAEYRTEHESFSRVKSFGTCGVGPCNWTVEAKSGQIMEFGNTSDSRVEVSTLPRGIARSDVRLWAINKVTDRAGNYMTFSYYEEPTAGIHVPTWIAYTGNGASQPYAAVQPILQTRPDQETFYEGGSQISSTHRIQAIQTFSSGNYIVPVKIYTLTYESALSPSTNRSRLQSIKECADTTGANCLNPTTITWQNGATGGPAISSSTSGFNGGPGYDDTDTRAYVDVNGDGKIDFCRFEGNAPAYHIDCAVNLGSGGAPQTITTSGFTSRGYTSRPGTAAYVDVNGDGKVDFCRFEGNPGAYYIYCTTNLGAGGPQQVIVTSGFNSTSTTNFAGYENPGTRAYIDVNADGRADYCRFEGNPGAYSIQCTTNLGSGGPQQITVTSGFTSTSTTNFAGYNDQPGTRGYFDVNGDGKADFCRFEGDPGVYSIQCTTNLGSGGPQQVTVTSGFNSTSTTTFAGYQNPGTRGYADVNGDGKPDFCRFEGNPGARTIQCTTNLGGGGPQQIFATSGFTSTSTTNFAGWENRSTRAYVDVNGDGKADFCRLEGDSPNYSIQCTVNLGNGGAQQVIATSGFGSGPGYDNQGTRAYVDSNGDGKPDFCRLEGDSPNFHIDCSTLGGNGLTPDLLTSVTNGLGAQTTITHKQLTDASVYQKGISAAPPYLDVQAPIYVVSNTSSSNGVGGTRDLRYFYYSATVRLQGGGMMGFGAMQVYDDLTSTIQTSWSRTDWPYQGFVYASQSQTYGGVLLSRTDSNLAAQLTYPGVYFSYPSSTTEKVYVANNGVTGSTLVNTVTTTNEFNELPQYGNPKKITVTDGAGYTKTSVNNYTNDATNWILGRLSCAAVTSTMPGGATLTRTSGFSYNATGFLTTETVEPGTTCPGALGAASTDANLRVTTSYIYDAYGNKQSATVSGGISGTNSYVAPHTTYSYFEVQGNNPAGRFPTRLVNAVGQTETHEFDPRFGAMTKLTGPNNVATSWVYDAFGRKTSETRLDGTSTSITYGFCVCPGYTDNSNISYWITTQSTGVPTVYQYFDILNRGILKTRIGFVGEYVDYDNIWYDPYGRIAKSFRPYVRGTAKQETTPTYDAIGRVTRETGPDGSTADYSYNGLTTTVTRSTGRGAPGTIASTTVVNTQGQKVSVTDAAGTVTSYTYDPFGSLLTTNAGGVVTSMAYNLRGFKTSMNDPDMGVWSYQYSALGELKQQTDAKLQVTTMSYDLLGRLINRSEPSLISNWYYDTYKGGGVCIGGKGKLCQVESNNGYNRTYSYDTLGRQTEVAYTIDDLLNPYRITTTYGVAGDILCPNSQGKVCTVTYPAATVAGVTSRFAVRNEYNGAGYLAKIWRHDLALTKPYWTGTAMNADGSFTGDSMGTSAADLTTVRDFDPLTGRLKAIKSGLAGATAAQFNRYVYDHLGNVTERHDDNMNVHETFTLDALSRLTQTVMTGTTAQTKTYGYDALGNLNYKSDLGTLTYGGPRPHAVTSITGNAAGVLDGVTNGTYSYDANGNMASSVQVNRTFTYTSFNLPSRIFNQNSNTNFIYDADHNRVSESYVNGTIIYVNPGNVTFFERHKNFNQGGYDIYRFFVHTPSGTTILFRRQSNNGAQTLNFQLKDNLGSTVADVDSAGNVVTRYSFDAFGKVRNPNGSATGGTVSQSRRGFTGHEHVLVGTSGLIHMNGRVYDSTSGRFTQADPQVQFAGFSQSYNRYSYTLNNPLSYTDPTGFGTWSRFRDKFLNPFNRDNPLTLGSWNSIANPFGKNGLIWGYREVFRGIGNGNLGLIMRGSLHAAAPGTYSLDEFNAANPSAARITTVVGQVACGFTTVFYAVCSAGVSAYSTAVMGGKNSDILKSAAIAYLVADAYSAVGTSGWRAPVKVFANGVIGGAASELQGGSFRQGFIYSAASSTLSEYYEYAVGQKPDALPGENRPGQNDFKPGPDGRQEPGDIRMNVIGKNEPLIPGDFWGNFPKQGGALSLTVNGVPGMNAFARLHDVWFNSGTLCCFTYTNIPSMFPAVAITYGALLSGPASVELSRDFNR